MVIDGIDMRTRAHHALAKDGVDAVGEARKVGIEHDKELGDTLEHPASQQARALVLGDIRYVRKDSLVLCNDIEKVYAAGLDRFGDVRVGVIGRDCIQHLLEPCVAGLQELDAELQLRKGFKATQVPNDTKAGRQLHVRMKLLQEIGQHLACTVLHVRRNRIHNDDVLVLLSKASNMCLELQRFLVVRIPYARVHELRDFKDFKDLRMSLQCQRVELACLADGFRLLQKRAARRGKDRELLQKLLGRAFNLHKLRHGVYRGTQRDNGYNTKETYTQRDNGYNTKETYTKNEFNDEPAVACYLLKHCC